ncbi:MAG: DUF1565 domain-containing protein [Gammaproteobacteria bacterium]
MSAMRRMLSVALLSLVFAPACGFPRPKDLGDDATSTPSDDAGIPMLPGTSAHASPSGDDANDGIANPVRTIRRAIAVASVNANITTIVLDPGRYGADTGEAFPYTVPEGLTIAGWSSGDVLLAGSGSETAFMLGSGTLQHLVFANFAVAVSATGMAHLNGVRVQSTKIAIDALGVAALRLENVDFTGIDITEIGGGMLDCSTGIKLRDSASLTATGLTTRGLRTGIDAADLSTVSVSGANISQDNKCEGTALAVNTSTPVTVSQSQITGGLAGMVFHNVPSSPAQATVTNTKFLNMPSPLGGPAVMFKMIGGEISGSSNEGLSTTGGNWSFTNVSIRNNVLPGIYAQGSSQGGIISFTYLTMRGCTITGNQTGGISLLDSVIVDLGTDLDPGNNTIQGNSGIGIFFAGTIPQQINAVGNTWNANTQGADPNGRYPNTATITGPVSPVEGANFALSSGFSIRR